MNPAPGSAPGAGATPAEVLGFWFGAPPWQPREAWFRKDPAFDAQIRERFGVTIERALAGALGAPWDADAPSRLAHIVVLDQFTRNAFRDSARAFAGDPLALALARRVVAAGDDGRLAPLQRWFVYLPFEHAEDLAAQDESVRLFEALAAEDPDHASALDYARRHREVVARFGRFPHRNRLLGRQSTADEAAFLQLPGSGF